ncbi:MAG: hypothetical protein ACYTAN_16275 [Planctomycetota bacterium]|jgi:hypothetical protein
MTARRTTPLITLAIAVAWTAHIAAWQRLTPCDEPLWIERSSRPIWKCEAPLDYRWAVDVSGMVRLVYGAALPVVDNCRGANTRTDYTLTYGENLMRGSGAKPDAVLLCRGVNVLAFAAALVALYLAALSLIRRPILALLPVAPLMLSRLYPYSIIPRLGPDALLAAWLAMFLLAWLWLDRRGRAATWRGAVTLGIVGGLCVFAKINGALAILAYATWLIVYAKGRAKWLAGLSLAAAFIVYYAANPAFWGVMPDALIFDVLCRRAFIAARSSQNYPLWSSRTWSEGLRCWPFVPLALWVLWRCRSRQLSPLYFWGLFIAAGNLALINLPLDRYLGPVELAGYFTVSVAWVLTVRKGKRIQGSQCAVYD